MAFPTPPARPAERRIAGIALRLAAVASFAVMAAAIKLAAERGVSLVELVFARNLFSLPVVSAWIALGPGWRAVRTKRPAAHLVRAAIGLGSMSLTFLALTLLPLADATTIGFSAPLFATLLSALILRETVGRHRWLAVAIGFVGVGIAMRPGGSALPAAGLLVAVVAALANGGVTITLRQIGATEGVAATVFWFTVACLVASGLVAPFFLGAHDAATWGLLAAMGFSGGLAQIFNTGSLRLAPVAVVVPFDYFQLLWAVLLGWALWRMPPSGATLAGGGLIVASGLYTLWREQRRHRALVAATPEL
ncbi:MAG: DMT family transporter [Sphingomonas sp.]